MSIVFYISCNILRYHGIPEKLILSYVSTRAQDVDMQLMEGCTLQTQISARKKTVRKNVKCMLNNCLEWDM